MRHAQKYVYHDDEDDKGDPQKWSRWYVCSRKEQVSEEKVLEWLKAQPKVMVDVLGRFWTVFSKY